MALAAVLKSLDGLSDGIKEHYVEKDGMFLLDVTPFRDGKVEFALEDVHGLKSSLATEKAGRAKAETALKPFDGLDATVAKEAIEKLPVLQAKAGDVDSQIEAMKSQLVEKHQQELTTLQDRDKSLTAHLQRALIDQVATEAIAGRKGNVKLLLPHIRSQTRMVEKDGNFIVEVINDQNETRIGNSAGAAMTIDELVEEMKNSTDFSSAFAGSGADGGGTKGNEGGQGSNDGVFITREDALDPRKYQAAKEKANAAGVSIQYSN